MHIDWDSGSSVELPESQYDFDDFQYFQKFQSPLNQLPSAVSTMGTCSPWSKTPRTRTDLSALAILKHFRIANFLPSLSKTVTIG